MREQLTLIVNEDSILDYVFWDTKELKRRTCMCWNTIQETFFYDPEFPKRKIGGKWYYPAREARQYLELWLMNQ
ncbi:group-specific protein [Paenibacillus sp. VCA1]|uniref:group-specific protein n=1 Tax=Paenibacillus sp. VCA1 TaxID=3039148 RepID=UPI0037C9422D